MEIMRSINLTEVDQINILKDVRVIRSRDLNPINSNDNLKIQFEISGMINGLINCYLCLDEIHLSPTDKNYLFPLFVESMNILIGQQIANDKEFQKSKLKLSPPKLSMNGTEINSKNKLSIQKYELQIDEYFYDVLIEYSLQALN